MGAFLWVVLATRKTSFALLLCDLYRYLSSLSRQSKSLSNLNNSNDFNGILLRNQLIHNAMIPNHRFTVRTC